LIGSLLTLRHQWNYQNLSSVVSSNRITLLSSLLPASDASLSSSSDLFTIDEKVKNLLFHEIKELFHKFPRENPSNGNKKKKAALPDPEGEKGISSKKVTKKGGKKSVMSDSEGEGDISFPSKKVREKETEARSGDEGRPPSQSAGKEKRPLTAMKQRKKETASSNQEKEEAEQADNDENAEEDEGNRRFSGRKQQRSSDRVYQKWKRVIEGILSRSSSPSSCSSPRSSAMNTKNGIATGDDDDSGQEKQEKEERVLQPPTGKKPVHSTNSVAHPPVASVSSKKGNLTIKEREESDDEEEEDLIDGPSSLPLPSGDQHANTLYDDNDDDESEIMVIPGKRKKEKQLKKVKASASSKKNKAMNKGTSSAYDAFLSGEAGEEVEKQGEKEDLITQTRKQFHSQLKQLQTVIEKHSKTISSLKHKSLSMENDYLKQQKDLLQMISTSSLDQQTLQSMILDRQAVSKSLEKMTELYETSSENEILLLKDQIQQLQFQQLQSQQHLLLQSSSQSM
jgi:hypothetical protein